MKKTAVVSLSPWSTIWTMGDGGGSSSHHVALECLSRINPNLLNFVEEGDRCDHGNIAIPIHMRELDPRLVRTLMQWDRKGIGRRVLLWLSAWNWKGFNQRFFDRVLGKLRQEHIERLDLVYCHSDHLVECGRRLGKEFNCPVVAHFYGTFMTPCIGNRGTYQNYLGEYLGWIAPVDLRICNDDGTRGLDVARELGLPLDRFMFQPHGMDTEELDAMDQSDRSSIIQDGTLNVITASRLVPWKRVDRLIRAVPAVMREVPNSRFVIVGDGAERSELEALAQSMGVANCITFTGSLPRRDVFALMRKSHVFVSTNDLSNVSRGLKEAMYLGLCIVTLDAGDTCSLVCDGVTGKLVTKDDTEALSSALIEVLSQPDERARLGHAASRFIREHEPSQEAVMRERIARLTSLMVKGQPLTNSGAKPS